MPVLETEGSGLRSGKGRTQLAKRDRLQAARTRQGDERAYTSTVIVHPSRVAPGPIPSCISTIARGSRFPSLLPSISPGGLSRQSLVSAVQPTRVSPFSRHVLGRQRNYAPWGPLQRRTGGPQTRLAPLPRRHLSPLASWRRGGRAPCSETYVVSIFPHAAEG